MEVLKNLELVQVEADDKKAKLVFLDMDKSEIREVNFNKQVYNDGKWIDDEDKAEKVEKWCADIFGTDFKNLSNAIGTKKDVYVYEKFNSLWESNVVNKFADEMVGQIFETEIDSIEDDGKSLLIKFAYDGQNYQSKMGYSDYMEHLKQWFVNPLKKQKQLDKFKDKFHVDFDDSHSLIGKKIMVEVKKAFGTHTYADIKPFLKKK